MSDIFLRTEMLIGKEALLRLKGKHIMLFGLGGVGSACGEALVRAGIGTLSIIDNDVVAEHNINRQIIASLSSVGMLKTEAFEKRCLDINDEVKIIKYPIFFNEESLDKINFDGVDYIIDAIDTISSKLCLAKYAFNRAIPIISCMGTGNRLHPELFAFAKIENTSYCPLCKVMRKLCKSEGIKGLEVLFSKEQLESAEKSRTPASISFVPPAAGMLIASKVINNILKNEE